jgi:hypothetical protein
MAAHAAFRMVAGVNRGLRRRFYARSPALLLVSAPASNAAHHLLWFGHGLVTLAWRSTSHQPSRHCRSVREASGQQLTREAHLPLKEI